MKILLKDITNRMIDKYGTKSSKFVKNNIK